MTARELLQQLDARGVVLGVDAGKLRVNAARGVLDDSLKTAIAAHKAELLELVALRSAVAASSRVPILPAPPSADAPLSYFQERLWVIQQLDPASTTFSLVATWLARTTEDVERLLAGIEAVMLRHEILRARFVDVDGTPRVMVLDTPVPCPHLVDWREWTAEEQKRRLAAAVDAAAHQPYDLQAGPPCRFTVYRVADAHSVVLLAAHHIALDAWSIGLLRREIDALCAGEPVAPEPRLQYRDFAAWQRRAQDSQEIRADLDWWVDTLDGAPPSSTFHPDRPPSDETASAVIAFAWEAGFCASVRAMAAESGATVYMAMVAACGALLRAHTGQTDIVLGNPTGVRDRLELEPVVGPFVDVQLMRLRLDDDPSFAELLHRTRNVLLDAHEHRQVPLELLLERLKPARARDHAPLFQVAVVQHNAAPHGDLGLAGGGALHELTVYFREIDGRIVGGFEYRADLYSAAAVARIESQLQTLLRAAVTDPLRPISRLSLLAPEASRQVLQEFNRTDVSLDTALFARQFEREAARHPERIAVTFEGQSLSYAALDQQASHLARMLRHEGVGPGVLVGVCVERSLELVVALVAVQKSGGAYVPLDTAFPVERLTFMLQDSGASVLIVSAASASHVAAPAGVRAIDPALALQASAALDGEALEPVGAPSDPAYVIYTSGSTGRPKGVVVSHGALTNFLGAMRREPGLSEADVLAAVTTVSFDIAALELYLPLLVGARVELLTRDTASDGHALAEQLDVSGATVLQATPATWRLLLGADWQPARPTRAFCGGESLPRELADSLLLRVAELWNLYGPTETTVWSTIERVRAAPAPITIGRPIANTQAYVLDGHLSPVPIGVRGELWLGGAGVALGYHGRPELDAQHFVPDPFSAMSGARLFRTGDGAMWDGEGRLHHLGRLDHQLKIRGFRVEPGEIETALLGHPAVKQAVVVGRHATPTDVRLVAYVIFQAGETLTTSDVRRHLRVSLPDYMIPSMVMTVDAIATTPNGKVDRAALPDPFRNAVEPGPTYLPPAPGPEQTMAQIWRDVLHVQLVGAEDNFFELGGHSLLALRVTVAVKKQLGRRLDPRLLFFRNLRQVTAAVVAADAEWAG